MTVPGWTSWVLVFAVLAAAAYGGAAVVATWKGSTSAPREAPEDTAAEIAADAEAVRAAAERAATVADEARDRADQTVGRRDEAEKRYLQARWQARTAAVDESQRLVQRAALDAYRRGEITVAQLNGIWQHTGGEGDPAEPDDDQFVRAAREEYRQMVTETASVRQEAHVAEVAAEVLAEEVRIVEQDVRDADVSGLDGLLDAERN
ncbi:hypothetical protein AB0M02_12790 [Actinoplanes sp. NPDC051861]|uniref:hypothetical protein n=1 Tax=Actinoplanes sp. NPDC051861 TaxID=3155170 RepID=UPI003445BDE6